MDKDNSTTLLRIPFPEEKSGRAALISLTIHIVAVLLLLFGARLFPRAVVQLGGGPGGGFAGDDITTVGVVDQLSGGAGMVKPALVPAPPALAPAPPKPEPVAAIPLPDASVAPKKKKPAPPPKPKEIPEPEAPKASSKVAKTEPRAKPAPQPDTNIIPTEAQPGSGGIASAKSVPGTGSGGGSGSGSGISVGTGAGGFGDSGYALLVERRLSAEWLRPPTGLRVAMTYSFYIAANGRIYDIKLEKSSGNPQIDRTGMRAIMNSNPLSAPPREFRGKAIQFVANFVHPPDTAVQLPVEY